MYLLSKIHKRLHDVPEMPVISNCGTPTEEALESLDNQLKEVIQNGWFYIKDSKNFIKKIKHLKNILDNAFIYLFYSCFNVIVVSVLSAFIIVIEPCSTCTLTELEPCSIGIEL